MRGTCGDNMSWSYNEDTGLLKIYGSGDMTDWSASFGLEAPWYAYRGAINKVEIGTGIKNIGDYAFKDLTKLNSVNIQAELQKIGSGAFENCTAEIRLPDGKSFLKTARRSPRLRA